MGNGPEKNHRTGNVLFASTISCKERTKTFLEFPSQLSCRQPCCCLQKYFYSPKLLKHTFVGFTIKTQQSVPEQYV